MRAAEQGKQVVALVELKARFDEQANIERARVLEEAGVHVVYGLVGLKTHAKILLVVRQEDDGIRRYCHVGTGNYNPETANLYEDIGLLSADPDLGADLTELFNYLTGYSRQGTLPQAARRAGAPARAASPSASSSRRRTGAAGRIVLKMNSLVDPALIDALYDASQHGRRDRPHRARHLLPATRVPGLSENIRVRSIVGRFLEHSRVYRFGADPETAEYLIGSADLMPRNLDRRVEAVTPVTDPRLRARLAEILDLDLADDVLAWELGADGTWTKVPTTVGISTRIARSRSWPSPGPTAPDPTVAKDAPRERELKFTPGPSFRLPAFDDDELVADPPDDIKLQAAYFDTADLRLARAGASLRFRNAEGWTVKLPVSSDGALVRGEIHLGGEPGDPPDAARRPRAGAGPRRAARAGRAPQHRAPTASSCAIADGEQLAEVVDDEVSVLDGGRLAARFRELEVELTDAAPVDLVEWVADRLRAAGAGEPEQLPKIVRALGPRALDPPDVVAPPKLDVALDPARSRSAPRSLNSTKRLLTNDPGVRLGDDPEAVHQARVATRRLRSDLRTFRPVVDPEWDASLREELKWLGGLLGAVRDNDVLLDRLEGRVADLHPSDRHAGKRLLDVLREHRVRARAELLEAMRSPRYARLLDRLVAAARTIPSSGDPAELDLELGDLVRKPWKKLRKAVKDLDEDPPDEELHAVRIRAKWCRYAAEAVAPAVGTPAKRFAAAVEQVQDVLGEHQDAVVAGQWLRTHAADSGGRVECAFVAGELAAREDVAADASRAEWPAAWKQAKRRSLRQWM